MTPKRNSWLELLRIISMIFIILHHYSIYTNFNFSSDISFERLFIQFLTIGGKIGVNCYIFISGYFLINSKFKVKSIIKLIIEILTYSLFFLLIDVTLLHSNLNFKNVIKSIFPTTLSLYWFFTVYLIVIILSPFLNKFINLLKKEETIKIILLLVIIQSIIPTFMNASREFSNILWFITIYMIGGYIRIYNPKIFKDNKKNIKMILISYIFIIFSVIIIDMLENKFVILKGKEIYFSKINSIFVLANSLGLFLLFRNLKEINNYFINKISSTMFGIYLIHENVFMRDIIWNKLIQGFKYQSSYLIIFNAIMALGLIMFFGIIIDLVRKNTIEKLESKIGKKIINKNTNNLNKIKLKIDIILNKLGEEE